MTKKQKMYFHASFPVNVLVASNIILIAAVFFAIITDSSQVGFSLGLGIDVLVVAAALLACLVAGLRFAARLFLQKHTSKAYLLSSLSLFFGAGLLIGTEALIEIYRPLDARGSLQTKHVFALLFATTVAAAITGTIHIIAMKVRQKSK